MKNGTEVFVDDFTQENPTGQIRLRLVDHQGPRSKESTLDLRLDDAYRMAKLLVALLSSKGMEFVENPNWPKAR